MCDIYDRLAYNRKKEKLIQQVLATAPRSPLRAGVWQRMTTIHMDRRDLRLARQTFEQAQRDDPDSPSIGLLEVQLLVAERWPEQARQRAEFYLRRLRKLGLPEDE